MESGSDKLALANNFSTIRNIFYKMIGTSGETEVTLQSLNLIIEKEMDLNLNNLDENQRKALPYMLSRFMTNWPGWSKGYVYSSGLIDLESCMMRFQNYINYKMQILVSKTLPNIQEEYLEETKKLEKVDRSTQTKTIDFSNFIIDLRGPASLLSNLVFSGDKDDIRVEEHSERQWLPLEWKDILNYPYVEVEFNSPELSFKRSFEPKVTQYLSCTPEVDMEETNFIISKSSLHSDSSKWPIKIDILEKYVKAFKAEIASQLCCQQDELIVILDEFYQDMVDISINNSVFENTRITFNIGRNVYKRTKQICNRWSSPDVIFNEIFLPRVITSFRYFTGMQNDSTEKRIADPNRVDFKMMLAFKPVITYKCTFCKIIFEGAEAQQEIMKHLKNYHRRAQTLVCLRCKKCSEVAVLSRQRWKCICLQ